MPVCTVVIPCFNDADRLAECLSALTAQTFTDWEAIVVDDASTIGDVQAVVDAAGDPRIVLVRHPRNRGLAAARNTGIRQASADLIFPHDSDDRLEPRCLEVLVGVLRDDSAADCVFPDFRLFGEVTGVQRFRPGDMTQLLVRQWLPGPGCLYRRSMWERAGGYCEDPVLRAGNEDWEFYVSASETGFVARHVPEPLYGYRMSGGSMSRRLQYVNHRTRELIHARHRTLYDRTGLGPEFLAEGYRASAFASLAVGERRRARRMALHSLRLRPSRSGVELVARSLVPTPVMSAGRAVKRRLRDALGSRR